MVPVKVFFDSSCGFCSFWKSAAEKGSSGAFQFIPMVPGNTSGSIGDSIFMEVLQERTIYGMAAVRRIVSKTPIMFPLLVPLAFSWFFRIDSVLYSFISRNRKLISRIMHLA